MNIEACFTKIHTLRLVAMRTESCRGASWPPRVYVCKSLTQYSGSNVIAPIVIFSTVFIGLSVMIAGRLVFFISDVSVHNQKFNREGDKIRACCPTCDVAMREDSALVWNIRCAIVVKSMHEVESGVRLVNWFSLLQASSVILTRVTTHFQP
mgnify:CR=1 FL=1